MLPSHTNLNDFIDNNLLMFFCVIAQVIWTIVAIVVLDQYYVSETKSIHKVLSKLFICTLPLLFCSELSISFICHADFVLNDLFIVLIKWSIFIATIFISFWTGILSDKNKIHGGQVAPKQQSPLYQFQY